MSVEFKELINVKLIHILSRVQVISAAIAGSFTAQLPTSIDKKKVVLLFLFYLTKVNNFFFFEIVNFPFDERRYPVWPEELAADNLFNNLFDLVSV